MNKKTAIPVPPRRHAGAECRRRARFWNQLCACVALAALAPDVYAQALAAPAPATERQYLDLIEQQQDEGGVTAPGLVEPLTALGQYYVEQQDYESAAAAFARARQIMRINNGFDSPQELALVAQQVAAERARGNVVEAWNLEQGLLQLARANVDSLDALPVFVAAANRRIELFDRYRFGEHPPEIELGCYYDRRRYVSALLLRLPPLDKAGESRADCTAGDRDTVMLALLVEARSFQFLAVETLFRNERYASDEMWQRVVEVLRTSTSIARRQLATSDPALQEMMVQLLSYEPKDPADAQRRAEFLLQLADMNVLRSREARRMSGFASVHQQYEQAWAAMAAAGMPEPDMQALFVPAVPAVLPSFATNPLARVQEVDAKGHIDVAFEITDHGGVRRVDVVEASEGIARGEIRELEQLLSTSSFRPRMQGGKVLKSAPVTVRYYVPAQ